MRIRPSQQLSPEVQDSEEQVSELAAGLAAVEESNAELRAELRAHVARRESAARGPPQADVSTQVATP